MSNIFKRIHRNAPDFQPYYLQYYQVIYLGPLYLLTIITQHIQPFT